MDWGTGFGPLEVATLNRWVADALAAGGSGSTARTRQLAVRRFAAWLLATGRLADDPFRGIKTSKVEPPWCIRSLRTSCALCCAPVTSTATPVPTCCCNTGATRRSSGSCSKPQSARARLPHWRSATWTSTRAWSPSVTARAARAARAESFRSARSPTVHCGPTCGYAPSTLWRRPRICGSARAAADGLRRPSQHPAPSRQGCRH